MPRESATKFIIETGKLQNIRISEHKKNVWSGEAERSRTAYDVWLERSRMYWDQVKMIHKEEKSRWTKLKKSTLMWILTRSEYHP